MAASPSRSAGRGRGAAFRLKPEATRSILFQTRTRLTGAFSERQTNDESNTHECGDCDSRGRFHRRGASASVVGGCGRVRRAAPVAQGDADLQRATGQRDRRQSESVHGLPDDRRVHSRVRVSALRSAGILRGRRRCREHFGDVRQQVAGARLTGQNRQMELASIVCRRSQRGAAADGDGAGNGAGRRRDRIVRRHGDEQGGPRLPRARPAAVRRQALPALRGIRRVFSEGRRRCARNAARL